MPLTIYITYILKTTCFILLGVSICHLLACWLENSDSSSIAFKEYNHLLIDRYPTFSFCVHSTGNGALYDYFSDELLDKHGLSKDTYEILLRGKEVTCKADNKTRYMSFKNISHIPTKNYTLKLIEVIQSMEFKTIDTNHSFEYNKWDGYTITDEDIQDK